VVPSPEFPLSKLPSRTILIVEDEALVRMVTADEFRGAGYVVIECANGDEAWELLISGVVVDLLFSDVQMPGRLDGLALALAARERFPTLPIIIASAHLPAVEAEDFDAFLQKPFSFEAARHQVASLLAEPGEDRKGKEPA
jgi:two-component system, response regulator PdtaR